MRNVLWILALLLTGGALSAQQTTPPSAWEQSGRGVPILAEGRIMPLESWAKLAYFRVSGRDNDGAALGWLLKLLAFPESAVDDPVILVDDPAVLKGLSEVPVTRGHLSARQLGSVMALGPTLVGHYQNDTTPLGREGLRLGQALILWNSIAATFLSAPEAMQSPLRLFHLNAGGLAPAQVAVLTDRSESLTQDYALLLYWLDQSRKSQWSEAAASLILLGQRSGAALGMVNQVELELWHSELPWIPVLAILGLLTLVSGLRNRGKALTAGLTAAALSWMTLWLVLRMLITGRPPVTSLTSTFLFTGWLSLALSLVFRLRHDWATISLWALCAGVVLPVFSVAFLGSGDPFPPLQAVLNTNFWLAIHVTTITAGYGAVLISALLGYYYLWRSTSRKSGNLTPAWKALQASLVWGLALTFVGTLLGGFWADQSWGRFWGWDPKENGALLIILWTALTLHLRPARWSQEWGTALAAAVGLAVLLFSWMGVNLLGVGFHSYGATQGKVTLFVGLLAAQLAILGWLVTRRVLR